MGAVHGGSGCWGGDQGSVQFGVLWVLCVGFRVHGGGVRVLRMGTWQAPGVQAGGSGSTDRWEPGSRGAGHGGCRTWRGAGAAPLNPLVPPAPSERGSGARPAPGRPRGCGGARSGGAGCRYWGAGCWWGVQSTRVHSAGVQGAKCRGAGHRGAGSGGAWGAALGVQDTWAQHFGGANRVAPTPATIQAPASRGRDGERPQLPPGCSQGGGG